MFYLKDKFTKIGGTYEPQIQIEIFLSDSDLDTRATKALVTLSPFWRLI